MNPQKDRFIAGFLALFLGGIGIHHLYLGNYKIAIIYFLLFFTGISMFLGFADGIIYLKKLDYDFQFNYHNWFCGKGSKSHVSPKEEQIIQLSQDKLGGSTKVNIRCKLNEHKYEEWGAITTKITIVNEYKVMDYYANISTNICQKFCLVCPACGKTLDIAIYPGLSDNNINELLTGRSKWKTCLIIIGISIVELILFTKLGSSGQAGSTVGTVLFLIFMGLNAGGMFNLAAIIAIITNIIPADSFLRPIIILNRSENSIGQHFINLTFNHPYNHQRYEVYHAHSNEAYKVYDRERIRV